MKKWGGARKTKLPLWIIGVTNAYNRHTSSRIYCFSWCVYLYIYIHLFTYTVPTHSWAHRTCIHITSLIVFVQLPGSISNESTRPNSRTIVLLHITYSEEPFVAESERLKWSTVDRELGPPFLGHSQSSV